MVELPDLGLGGFVQQLQGWFDVSKFSFVRRQRLSGGRAVVGVVVVVGEDRNSRGERLEKAFAHWPLSESVGMTGTLKRLRLDG